MIVVVAAFTLTRTASTESSGSDVQLVEAAGVDEVGDLKVSDP